MSQKYGKQPTYGRQTAVDKSKIDVSINEQKAYEFLVRNQEAKEWIEDMIDKKLPPGTANFADHLRDGVFLCELANGFLPGSVPKIHKPRIGSVLEFMATDNINQFFRACEKIKFPSIYMFSVPDLWEKKNVYKIVHCIHSLAHFVVTQGIRDVRIKKLKGAVKFDQKEMEESKNLLSKLEQDSGPISFSFNDDDDAAVPTSQMVQPDSEGEVDDVEVKDEPSQEEELADPDRCEVVQGAVLERMRAGDKNAFVLQARDADSKDIKKGGEKWHAELVRSKEEESNGGGEDAAVGHSGTAEATVVDYENGLYEFSYQPLKAGTYYFTVQLVDQVDENEEPDMLDVTGLTRVKVVVDAAEPDATHCKMEGAGLESGVAGVSSEFKVLAFDKYDNRCLGLDPSRLKVHLTHQKKPNVQVDATVQQLATNTGDLLVTYNCPMSGTYGMQVLLDGQPISSTATSESGSVLAVVIKDAGISDPTRCKIEFQLAPQQVQLEEKRVQMIAGQAVNFQIIAHDKHGNVRSSGGEKFTAELVPLESPAAATITTTTTTVMEVKDSNDGHYWVNQTMERSGEYKLVVKLGDSIVDGEPIALVINDAGSTDPSTSVTRVVDAANHGSETDLNGVRAGSVQHVLVEPRDKFGNVRSKLNDDERLVLVVVSKKSKEQVIQYETTSSSSSSSNVHQYALPFELSEAGEYVVEALLQNVNDERAVALPGYPRELKLVESGQSALQKCKFKGDYEKTRGNVDEKAMQYDGFTRALCNNLATFSMATFDKFGNARTSGGDKICVELFNTKRNVKVNGEVRDLGDGTYEITYVPPTSGNYQIKVFLGGELVVTEQLPADAQTLFVEPPPVKDIKPDIDVIDDHDLLSSLMNSFVVEQDNEGLMDEIHKLREQLIKQIRTNTQVESEVKELDRKIQLLASNHAKAEELLQSSRGFFAFLLGGNKPNQGNRGGNQQPDTPLKDPKKLALYSKMFYLLQVDPKYLSQCLYLVAPEKVDKFLETVILTLYGYAYSPREEFLMLNLFKNTLELEISKSKKLGGFLNNNPVLPKMVMTYGRRVQGKNFLQRTLFDKILNNILGDKELNLELNAVKLLKDHIAKQEVNTGVKSTVNLRDLTYEKAMENEVVALQVKERVDKLTELCQAVLDGIIANVGEIPYGLRWVCRQLELMLKQKHPESTEAERASVVGYIVYYRFMNPAIVSPDFFGLTKKNQKISMNMRNNLVIISKVLTNLTNNVLFDSKIEAQMTVMNEWLKRNQKVYVEQFIRNLTQVGEPEDTLGVHQFMELSLKKTPSISVTWNEIFSTHSLLLKYASKLCSPENDPLKQILDQLGAEVPDELPPDRNEEIALPLTPMVEKDVDKAQTMSPQQLYDQAKHHFRFVLKSLPVDSLGENVMDTLANAKKLHVEQASDKSRQIMQKIVAIEEVLPALEAADILSKSNSYRKLLLDITDEIQNQKVIRQKQQKELERLKESLKSLEDHYKYLKDRIIQFKEYIEDNIRKQFKQGSSSSSSSGHNQQTIGRKKKYTFKQLKDKGVIEDLSVMQSQASKITFVISMTSPGQFAVEAKLLGMTVKTINVLLDDLLDKQSKGQSTIQYDNVVLNVNLTLHLFNKNFAAKN